MAGGATQHAGGNMAIPVSKWDFLSQNETRTNTEQKPIYMAKPNFQSQNETTPTSQSTPQLIALSPQLIALGPWLKAQGSELRAGSCVPSQSQNETGRVWEI